MKDLIDDFDIYLQGELLTNIVYFNDFSIDFEKYVEVKWMEDEKLKCNVFPLSYFEFKEKER